MHTNIFSKADFVAIKAWTKFKHLKYQKQFLDKQWDKKQK